MEKASRKQCLLPVDVSGPEILDVVGSGLGALLCLYSRSFHKEGFVFRSL